MEAIWDKYYSNFFNNLLILKAFDKLNNYTYFKSLHDDQTVIIGNYCLEQLEDRFKLDPNLFIKDNKPNLTIIKKCCSSINKAIVSFEKLSKEFLYIYEELNKREKKIITNIDDDNNNQLNELQKLNQIDIEVNIEEEKYSNENNWWEQFFN